MKKIFLILGLSLFFTVSANAQLTAFTSEDALKVNSFSLADVTNDGNYIAGFIRSRMDRLNIDHKRYGDPNYVAPNTSELVIIDTNSGSKKRPFENKEVFGNVKWSPDGKSLAVIKYDEGQFNLYMYDLLKNQIKKIKIDTKKKISSGSELNWIPNSGGIIVSLREDNWSVRADSLFKEATIGPVTVYDSKQDFLKWDVIRNHSNLEILAMIDLKNGKTKVLTEEGSFRNLKVTEDGSSMVYIQTYPLKTVYDRRGGTEYELNKIDLNSFSVSNIEKKTKKGLNLTFNSTNSLYAYADSGKVFIRSIAEEKSKLISVDTTEILKGDTVKVKFSIERWSPDDKYILASSKTGYWLLPVETGEIVMVYDFPEDKEASPNLNIVDWSPDSRYLYMSYSAKDRWERGIVRYDLESKEILDLVKDQNLYSRWTMSKDGSKFFVNFSDGNDPSDLFVYKNNFSEKLQLTDLNPWIKTKKISKSQLIKYRDSDGKELYGVLYYPVDYEAGKKYPMVCEIYETFFDNGYSMSMNLLANAGYFGFKPSVNLEMGYPGEAWIKGITSGINKLIDEGLVDEESLGVQGTSYGGYATSLLITQTNRFAAAINISGKADIISFLGDSPRIGTRNYSAAEVGQDRIGESLWDAPLKYFATTAVLYADRVKTPHLLLTGEGDWNVPAVNSREIYYALRRLGKEVMWVNYYNGGHGAGGASTEADFHDQWERIINWYESHFNKDKSIKDINN